MREPRPSCEIHARYSRGCSECHRTEIDAFRAEVAALRAQLQTEIEQFKAEVAVALEELRADWQRQKIEAIDPSESLYPDQQGHNSMVESFVEDLDAVIIKLGLTAEATEVSEGRVRLSRSALIFPERKKARWRERAFALKMD